MNLLENMIFLKCFEDTVFPEMQLKEEGAK